MKFNHIGVAVRDINKSIKHYSECLGWVKLSDIVYDSIQKVKICFMIDNSNICYELIEPAYSDSPVTNVLNRKSSIYHTCYEVDDIEESVKELSANGFIQISNIEEAIAFDNRRIVFLVNRDNLIIELLEEDKKK